MWLFTRYGFFSVVCAHGTTQTMMIRARCRRHLAALLKRFSWLPKKIRENNGTDYRYRILVAKDDWLVIADELANEINYENFKEATGKKDKEYSDALLRIWAMMHALQPYPPQPKHSIHDSNYPFPESWGLPQDD
jgi:hypothetical protein